MKLRIPNEVKVGVLALLVIVLFLVGLGYLRGRSVLEEMATVQAEFGDVRGLYPGSAVKYLGLQVGKITELEFSDSSVGVRVTMEVSRKAHIPADSRVVIRVPTIGSPHIEILRGSSASFVADGATLIDSVALSLVEIAQTKLDPIQQKLDSTLGNLEGITDGLRRTVEGQNTQMRRVMNNVEQATANIAEGTRDLRPTIARVRALVENFHTTLDSLKRDENLRQTVANARQFSDSLVASTSQLRTTLATAERTIATANNLITRLDTAQGALGEMLFDDATLGQLTQTITDLDALLADLRAHPKRYVHFSVFGRRERPAE